MSSRRGLAGERGSMSGRELLVFSYELGVLSRDAMLASDIINKAAAILRQPYFIDIYMIHKVVFHKVVKHNVVN